MAFLAADKWQGTDNRDRHNSVVFVRYIDPNRLQSKAEFESVGEDQAGVHSGCAMTKGVHSDLLLFRWVLNLHKSNALSAAIDCRLSTSLRYLRFASSFLIYGSK